MCSHVCARLVQIQLILSVQSQRVVQTYAAWTTPPQLCLVMEYMEGGSLAQALFGSDARAPLPLTLEQRLELAAQIAEGMRFLHEGAFGDNPIVHHDLKPENVMLTAKLDAKIADFGLSRTRQGRGSLGSKGKAGVGTPLYMAPECFDVCHSALSPLFSPSPRDPNTLCLSVYASVCMCI